ncbi:MAG: GTPase domain-containing protein [Myxococcales bacterium]|nr:GTPase domain-containing protein [Myxococcales bacterium]
MVNNTPTAIPEASSASWADRIDEGISLLGELLIADLPFPLNGRAETLLCLCHHHRFRRRTGGELPLIGILGSASSGKSTLLNSIAGAPLAKVTPIPHQTTGAIVALPVEQTGLAADDSFLRPSVKQIQMEASAVRGLSGEPETAMVVPAWSHRDKPFLLIDLPDIGTLEAREEHLVALRILPWLDRVILLVTEESFAQAEHETIREALRLLRPERARADLFVVLNRLHAHTSDEEFHSRLENLKEFWGEATISTLPHLTGNDGFKAAEVLPLVAESHPRIGRAMLAAIRNLAQEVATETESLAVTRQREQERVADRLRDEIVLAARFKKAFFSDEFRRRLDTFSPWRTSLNRWRKLLGDEAAASGGLVDLFSESAVQKHVAQSLAAIQTTVARQIATTATGDRPAEAPPPAPLDLRSTAAEITSLVEQINREARQDVATLLEALEERHRLKDPVWGTVTAVASTLFLLDLVVPSLGTLSSLTLLGALSALGLGGIFTSDLLRKVRTGRLREMFESSLQGILTKATDPLWRTPALKKLELRNLTRRLQSWERSLPEVR